MAGMNMGMRSEHRLELQVEITIEQMQAVLAETAPFKDRKLKTEDIEDYLKGTNSLLVDRRNQPDEELRKRYVTTAAIYTFALPVLGIEIDLEIRTNFANIVGKGPYDMGNPLDVYFQRRGERLQVVGDAETLTIDQKTIEKEVVFKRGEPVKQKLTEALHAVASRLNGQYENEDDFAKDHFMFIGLHDVCAHLFGVRVKYQKEGKDKVSAVLDLYEKLKTEYGQFVLEIPQHLQQAK
ncbi:hypothetical protein GOV09_00380 [Candidatus Woesearchaeota archaeon]|nr:hypothetical protein [Candidatus Woesearchaeota archaeon]